MTYPKALEPWVPGRSIMDLNIKCKTIKLFEKKIEENLQGLEPGKGFLDLMLKI